jgi:hypothetical protein
MNPWAATWTELVRSEWGALLQPAPFPRPNPSGRTLGRKHGRNTSGRIEGGGGGQQRVDSAVGSTLDGDVDEVLKDGRVDVAALGALAGPSLL